MNRTLFSNGLVIENYRKDFSARLDLQRLTGEEKFVILKEKRHGG